jgi:hypothetical protein
MNLWRVLLITVFGIVILSYLLERARRSNYEPASHPKPGPGEMGGDFNQ